MNLKDAIRTIPNWPKEGIMFRDITTLLSSPKAFRQACDELYERYKEEKIDAIAGIESRGFIFGSVLAYQLGVNFIPIRKPGKLPSKTISQSYEYEYSSGTIEIHEDALKSGDKILLVDDLIATGGSAVAAIKLIEKLGGEIVEVCFVIELPELKGRDKLKDYKVFSLLEFEGE